jgi:hypothetical protein
MASKTTAPSRSRLLFDSTGKTVRVVYGAPPDLHQQVGKLLDGLLN